MSQKNAQKFLTAKGGAAFWADLNTPLIDPADWDDDFVFDKAIYHDFGTLITPPKMTEDVTSSTVDPWNMDEVTLDSKTKWAVNFATGQLDFENARVKFNAEFAADGSFTPGSKQWNGQLIIVLVTPSSRDLIQIPDAQRTGGGDLEFIKGEVAQLDSVFAMNPSAQLSGGKPWRWTPGTRLAPETA